MTLPSHTAVQAEFYNLGRQKLLRLYLLISAIITILLVTADLLFADLGSEAPRLFHRALWLHSIITPLLLVLCAARSLSVPRQRGTLTAILSLAISPHELLSIKLIALGLWSLLAKAAMLLPLLLVLPWLESSNGVALMLLESSLLWCTDWLLISFVLCCCCVRATEGSVLLLTITLWLLDLGLRMALMASPWLLSYTTLEPQQIETIGRVMDQLSSWTPGAALNAWNTQSELWGVSSVAALLLWLSCTGFGLSRCANRLLR